MTNVQEGSGWGKVTLYRGDAQGGGLADRARPVVLKELK